MIDHILLISYLIIFKISIIGYGFLFAKIFEQNFYQYNLGAIGLIGIFFSIFISALTSFFIAHDYFHIFIFHSIGVLFFVLSFNKIKVRDLKIFGLLIILMISAIYVSKNHDDFPYYHLTYALNLSENGFLIGMGSFSHGFRTPSSIFYFHSLFFLPGIKFFLFHSGPFIIMFFFNTYILSRIREDLLKKKINFLFFLSLLFLTFVNIVFYRLGEHGADKSSQILLLLIFLIFFEVIYFKEKKISSHINLIIILTALAASIKVLYIIYFILIFFLFFEKKISISYMKKNFILFSFVGLFSFLFILKSFLSTGCLIYPAKFTCYEKFSWSVPKQEVQKLNIHYEWWAKAGGDSSYKYDLPKKEYIKDFNWIDNWLEKHFFGKVTDTLGGIALISIIYYLLFSKSKNFFKINRKNFFIYNTVPFIFIFEWFFNHPAMRYGGYVLFSLPVFIFLSHYLEQRKDEFNSLTKKTLTILIIVFLIFNIRNFIRISKEVNQYGYEPLKKPFFYIPQVKSKIITHMDELNIYAPKNNMCWASKTPCSYNHNLNLKKINGFYVIFRDAK